MIVGRNEKCLILSSVHHVQHLKHLRLRKISFVSPDINPVHPQFQILPFSPRVWRLGFRVWRLGFRGDHAPFYRSPRLPVPPWARGDATAAGSGYARSRRDVPEQGRGHPSRQGPFERVLRGRGRRGSVPPFLHRSAPGVRSGGSDRVTGGSSIKPNTNLKYNMYEPQMTAARRLSPCARGVLFCSV